MPWTNQTEPTNRNGIIKISLSIVRPGPNRPRNFPTVGKIKPPRLPRRFRDELQLLLRGRLCEPVRLQMARLSFDLVDADDGWAIHVSLSVLPQSPR
jgi:hypothetical protein